MAEEDQAPADGETPPEEKPTEPPQENTPPEPPTFNKEALLRDLNGERTRRKALQAEVEQLKANAASLADAQKASEATQRKYDRLEKLLLASDSSLSQILDSRTLTTRLFETDDDVAEILKAWTKAHPSKTSTALGSGGGKAPADDTPSVSDILRAAISAAR